MERFESQNNNVYSKNTANRNVKTIDFTKLASSLSKEQRKNIVAEYDMPKLEKVFSDSGIMQTIDVFLQNGMNVSLTARVLYMHRNTLIYKLNSIRKLTGLDLRDFNMAATFKILHALYVLN